MGNCQDKIVLISGTTSGIGASTAKIFADQGTYVIVAHVDDFDAKAVEQDIANSGAAGVKTFGEINVLVGAPSAAAYQAAKALFGTTIMDHPVQPEEVGG